MLGSHDVVDEVSALRTVGTKNEKQPEESSAVTSH